MGKPGFFGLFSLPQKLTCWDNLYDIAVRLPGFKISAEVLIAQSAASRLIEQCGEEGSDPELLDRAAEYYASALNELQGSLAVFFIEFRRDAIERFNRAVIHPDPFEVEARRVVRKSLREMFGLTSQEKFDLRRAFDLMVVIGSLLDGLSISNCSCRTHRDSRWKKSLAGLSEVA
jgi:hypothetical protein